MPELKDPNFERTVVLLSEFNENGAIGFVINRPSALTLGASVTLTQGTINPAYEQTNLWTGGPVEPQKIWILYDGAAFDDAHAVALGDGVNLARDVSILSHHEKALAPEQIRVIHGYAGWSAKQLSVEIAASYWIVVPLTQGLLFRVDAARAWETAIRALGIDLNQLVAPTSPFLN